MDGDNRFPPSLPWRGRLAVLSRQLTQGGEGAAGGESGKVVAAAPTFSTSSVSVVVLGGCVMDVVATPSPGFALSAGGSVPGSVSLTPGGVGRNVACAIAGMLLPPPTTTTPRSHVSPLPPPPRVSIVSVVGADPAGDALVASLERAGVDASGVGRLSPSSLRGGGGGGAGGGAAAAAATTAAAAAGTPVVVVVHDGGTGDVACSVADVAAVERCFTPAVVRRELSRVERENGKDSVTVIVVDGNLSTAAVSAAASASSSSPPGIALFEPVSVAKGVRAVREGGLRCRVMTPNAAELLAMARAVVEEGGGGTVPPPERSTSLTSTSTPSSLLRLGDGDVNKKDLDSFLRSTLCPAARALISRGVCEFVLVTLGEQGAALIGREADMAPLRERTDVAGLLFAAPAARRKDNDSNNSLKLAACVVPAAPVPRGVVSTGGAGDAFAAGFLAAACRGARSGGGGRGKESEEARTTSTATIAFALAAGAAAAAQVVSSPLSSPALDVERVWECAREVERQARFVTL